MWDWKVNLPVGLDLAAHDLFVCDMCETLGDIEDSVRSRDGVLLLCATCAGVKDEG